MPKSSKLGAMTIGKRIAELRRKKGLTMDQLAKKAEVTQGQISFYESDDQVPKLPTAVKIAKALEVPLSYLAEGSEGISPFENLMRVVADLPKSDQSKIKALVKNQIALIKGRELVKDL